MPANPHAWRVSGRAAAAVRAAVLALLLHGPAAQSAIVASAGVEADLAAVLAQQELTGAVWSLVAADGTTEVGAAGERDARSGAAMRPDDRVHVGSIAKALVATGVLRLVSDGRLTLDMPVAELLPDAAFDNPWAASDPVRVRHLLDHTAGIDDARMWQVFSRAPTADTPLARAFAGDNALLRVRSRPGSHFSYSNMGYGLLGRVIEVVARERYESFLDRELLRPLSMHDSTFQFVSQEGPHADPRLAMGHFENGQAQPAVPTFLRPATQFTTTAADMARFARFLLGDGRIGSAAFIDRALLRAMGVPIGTDAARSGLRIGFGLGLSTRDRHGVVGRCHGGDGVGYVALLCLYPEQQRAFFYSVNADSEGADYGLIERTLVDALGVDPPAPAAAVAPPIDAVAWMGCYVPAPGRFAQFAYLDALFGLVCLRADADGLVASPLQAPGFPLELAGAALYRAPDRAWPSHVLLLDTDGSRWMSRGTQSYREAPLRELAPRWMSLIAGLLGAVYLLVAGTARALSRRLRLAQPIGIPWLALLALALPVPLFMRQSFLQLGDLTAASALLAGCTAALPLAMLVGLYRHLRHRPRGAWATVDAVAMVAVLQWTVVLALWRLLPLRLWA